MKPIIVANWKMNPDTPKQAKALFLATEQASKLNKAEVIVCAPYPYLTLLRQGAKKVSLGGQDCSWEKGGALTGEVSAQQLKSIGCTSVILGHSERKKYLGETLGMTQAKMEAALKAQLRVFLCIENLRELQIFKKKTKNFKNVVLVFEPSSAISTQGGKRVAPKDIALMATAMKKIAGKNVPVLYGGSVGANSISSILLEGKVQGVLVGAASLNAREFQSLVKKVI